MANSMRSSSAALALLAVLVYPQSASAQRNSQAPRAGGAAVMSVTDPAFSVRLGSTVGVMPPGVGNINSPGTAPNAQPLPTQVQPLINMPPGYPNINSPGGVPGIHSGPQHFPGHDIKDGRKRHGGFHKRTPKVIFYGIPYYAPYVIYPEPVPSAGAIYPKSYDQPGTYPAPEPPPDELPSEEVTVLAFKDRTAVLVTDYWLEGDRLWYETSSGAVTSAFLDQLDLPLTQQINRERGVRFILEARP